MQVVTPSVMRVVEVIVEAVGRGREGFGREAVFYAFGYSLVIPNPMMTAPQAKQMPVNGQIKSDTSKFRYKCPEGSILALFFDTI